MKTVLFCALISLISWGIGQAQDNSKEVSNDVEQQVEFPGGPDKFAEYLNSEIKKAKEKTRARAKGQKVALTYEIDKTGKVCNVRRVANGESGLWAKEGSVWEKEAIRII